MSNQEFLIKKIPLEGFINILTEAYNGGAVFIDIVGSCNSEQDTLRVIVRDNYFERVLTDNIDTHSVFPEEDLEQLI